MFPDRSTAAPIRIGFPAAEAADTESAATAASVAASASRGAATAVFWRVTGFLLLVGRPLAARPVDERRTGRVSLARNCGVNGKLGSWEAPRGTRSAGGRSPDRSAAAPQPT